MTTRAARSTPVRNLRTKIAHLEKEISSLEARQQELTAALEAPETYAHPGKAQTINRELSAEIARLQAATAEWERASADLERLEPSAG